MNPIRHLKTVLRPFPWVRQRDSMQCGVACLTMVCRHFGMTVGTEYLDTICGGGAAGISIRGLEVTARGLGFDTMCVCTSLEKLRQADLPVILHWNQNHFVVLYRISGNGRRFHISDPAKGRYTVSEAEFSGKWLSTTRDGIRKGVMMMLEPGEGFKEACSAVPKPHGNSSEIAFLWKYVREHRRYFLQIFLAMLIASLVQILFPFLTQAIVDVGIQHRDIGIIWLILCGELAIIIGRTASDFIRRWLVLHISMRINVRLVSDFIIKLLKLPMRFFDSRNLGDFLRRMDDHRRIQDFLTSQAMNVVFVSMTMIVLGLVLAFYDLMLFAIYIVFSGVYALWISLFLHKRRVLDFEVFEAQGTIDDRTYRLLTSMQEIKLQNCEKIRRWDWEDAQADLFDVRMKSLRLQQTQEAGAVFINEIKNILITVIAATAVIHGSLTLGAMMAILFIIGQLNGPIDQLIGFIYSMQDVRISLERINEVRTLPDEAASCTGNASFSQAPALTLQSVSFKYDIHSPEYTLEDIDIEIPAGKTTAIVGASGSGKTTLLKLLLGFYPPASGKIIIAGKDISEYGIEWWRSRCGTVMQDGVVFSDSIARNIALCDKEEIDDRRLRDAARIACMDGYVERLPLRYDTVVGADGRGLSQGQKQRILIARAVYRNPSVILFDEATNSLDASNERAIVDNLASFLKGRTAIVVAHRLSTVRNADNIIVLKDGRVAECGTHDSLVKKKGAYYELVRNQLELGN